MEDDPNRPLKVLLFLALAAGAVFWGRKWLMDKGEFVAWRNDLDEARRESVKSGKPVLLYFTADWCPPCQKMKQTTWQDPRVMEALKKYVPVKVDVDDKGELARRFGVRSIPRVQLLTRDGTPGAMMSGYVSSDAMADWLR